MAGKDENTEKLVLSMLTSTQSAMSIAQLRKEFKEMFGYPLPFKENGFLTEEQYLRSMTTTVMVIGSGVNAKLKPFVKEKSSHVFDFVMNQKPANRSNRRFPRRNNHRKIWSTNYQPNMAKKYDTLPNCNTDKPDKIFVEDKRNFDVAPKNFDFASEICKYEVPDKCSTENSYADFIASTTSSPKCTERFKSFDRVDEVKLKHGAIPKIKVDDKPKYNDSNFKMPSPRDEETCRISKLVIDEQKVDDNPKYNESNFTKPSPRDKETCKIPKLVVDKLQKIIDEHPEGITCSSIIDLYFNKYGEQLSYVKYGYPSLILLCKDTEIFYIEQPNVGDFKLYNRKNSMPDSKYLLGNLNSDDEESPDSALKTEIDYLVKYHYYPHDVLKHEDDIPNVWISPETKEGDFIELVVTEVYDPSKFWIILNLYELNKLMDEMQAFYKHNKNLKVPKVHMKVGFICVAILYNEFHRVIIVNTSSIKTNILKVHSVDYGSVMEVSTDCVYYLHKQFSYLQQQCIRARLAKIHPPIEKTPWCQKARSNFCSYVKDRELTGKIYKILDHNILELYLIDRENHIVINDALIKDKVAILTSEKQKEWHVDEENFPLINDIYLVPLFEDLERGLAYNLNERFELERRCIPLSLIFPKYYQNVSESVASSPTLEKVRLKNLEGLNRSYFENYLDHSQSSKTADDAVSKETVLRSLLDDTLDDMTSNKNKAALTISSIDESLISEPDKDDSSFSSMGITKIKNYKSVAADSKVILTPVATKKKIQPMPVATANIIQPTPVATANIIQPTPVATANIIKPTPVAADKKIRPPPGYTELDLQRNKFYNAIAANQNHYNNVIPQGYNYGMIHMSVVNNFPVINPVMPMLPPTMPYIPLLHAMNMKPAFPAYMQNNHQYYFNNYTRASTMPETNQQNRFAPQFNQHRDKSTESFQCNNTSTNDENENVNVDVIPEVNQPNPTEEPAESEVQPYNRVVERQLKSKLLHVIYYNGSTYALVAQLLDNYTAVLLPMNRIKRLVGLNASWTIDSIYLNECQQIEHDLVEFGLIAKLNLNEHIYIITMEVVPEFLAIFGIEIDKEEFEEILKTL